MRPARVAAVLRRELQRSGAGRRGLSFAVVGLGLLLPAGALRLPDRAADPRPAVAGEVPADLEGVLRVDPGAAPRLEPGPPLRVHAAAVPTALRAALDAREAPGPAVRLALPPAAPLRLPDRALLVALLAISLLTGPLAETLPGEREARTLEVLLSTSLSRGELVLGKWLTWTAVASAAALLAGLSGMATGALAAGPWLLAMPAALGFAVAYGLFLVRGAADLVGGAATPMRVLPVAAVGGALLALGLARVSPLLGAAVPLGGALLVAGGLVPGWPALALAVTGSGLGAAALLVQVTRALDHHGLHGAEREGGAGATLAFGALGWALAAGGPAVFALGGASGSAPGAPGGRAAGALLLALVGAVALLRQGRAPRAGPAWGAGVGALAGGGLGLLGPSWPLAAPGVLGPFLDRLGPGHGPVDLAVAAALSLTLHGALQPRLGALPVALAWALLWAPADPAGGLAGGALLALLQARLGFFAALAGALALAAAGAGG